MKIKLTYLIWLWCGIIIAEVFWLNWQLEQLIKKSPSYLQKIEEQKINQQLKNIPEPVVEEMSIPGIDNE